MQKVSEDAGITAFIDKRGRSWNMASYTDMLCRTSSMQIFHQAKTNEYLAHGEDLVIVTSHTPTCAKCAPWNGKILSLTGETPGFPTMDEARAAGLFHPNCRHTYGLYIEDDEEATVVNKNNHVRKEIPVYGIEEWHDIKGEHTINDDAEITNPYRGIHDGREKNCQRCVVAYEMRRRGFDVVAKPAIIDGEDAVRENWRNLFYDAKWISCDIGSGQAKVERLLNEWGDGASAEIYVFWKKKEYAHVFVAENRKNKIVYVDPQTGETGSLVEKYFADVRPGFTEVCRIDNLTPTGLVMECCEERRGK